MTLPDSLLFPKKIFSIENSFFQCLFLLVFFQLTACNITNDSSLIHSNQNVTSQKELNQTGLDQYPKQIKQSHNFSKPILSNIFNPIKNLTSLLIASSCVKTVDATSADRKLLFSSSTFFKVYGGTSTDSIVSLTSLYDRSIISCGHTKSDGQGERDVFIIKFDQFGERIWENTYGGISIENCYEIIGDNSQNILFIGRTKTYGAGNFDFLSGKINVTDGTVIWIKAFGGNADDIGNGIYETSSGDILYFGQTKSGGEGNNDAMIIKTDQYGSIKWSKVLGGINSDIAYSGYVTQNDNILISGSTESFGSGGTDPFVAMLDNNGNFLWGWTLGQSSGSANKIHETSNNESYTTGTVNGDYFLYKFNNTGSIIWAKLIGEVSGNELNGQGSPTSDGGYLITGQTSSYGTNWDIPAIKIDQNGNLAWAKKFGENVGNYGEAIIEADNGDIYLGGRTNGAYIGENDMILAMIENITDSLCSEKIIPNITNANISTIIPFIPTVNNISLTETNLGSSITAETFILYGGDICSSLTDSPSFFPTNSPSSESNNPTKSPSLDPTKYPTSSTSNPTELPTDLTTTPTNTPSNFPSNFPTINPTSHPSKMPTTNTPTLLPTETPTLIPTLYPTTIPTINPTSFPSETPSNSPTINPTLYPSKIPSNLPSSQPTKNPTQTPSIAEASNTSPQNIGSIPAQYAIVDQLYTYKLNTSDIFYDPDGDELTLSAIEEGNGILPEFLVFNIDTDTFTGLPSSSDIGNYFIKVSANDNNGGSISDIFVLQVSDKEKKKDKSGSTNQGLILGLTLGGLSIGLIGIYLTYIANKKKTLCFKIEAETQEGENHDIQNRQQLDMQRVLSREGTIDPDLGSQRENTDDNPIDFPGSPLPSRKETLGNTDLGEPDDDEDEIKLHEYAVTKGAPTDQDLNTIDDEIFEEDADHDPIIEEVKTPQQEEDMEDIMVDLEMDLIKGTGFVHKTPGNDEE